MLTEKSCDKRQPRKKYWYLYVLRCSCTISLKNSEVLFVCPVGQLYFRDRWRKTEGTPRRDWDIKIPVVQLINLYLHFFALQILSKISKKLQPKIVMVDWASNFTRWKSRPGVIWNWFNDSVMDKDLIFYADYEWLRKHFWFWYCGPPKS